MLYFLVVAKFLLILIMLRVRTSNSAVVPISDSRVVFFMKPPFTEF